MNHAFDAGEWSSAYDEDCYDFELKKFKEYLAKIGVSINDFLENIEVAILKAVFGVAENGSVWITDEQMRIRALPFICQHLSVVLNKTDFVNNMHEAYRQIGNNSYDFGVFIAGPSKTADIEQSLVLGAHGPKTMTVFILV